MCGIGGFLRADAARSVEPEELAAMRRALRHRGPDDEGEFRDGPCGLAHTRLAILDLSPRAHQPMVSASGRFVIAYNGEIYNFRELRDALQRGGRSFSSESDTEVVLQLFEEEGLPGVERLEGMFAFALYDRERRELLLVRDRLGIKPLFYVADEQGIAFASEPKALPLGGAPPAPSAARIAEYLAFRHLAGEESLDPRVRTLLPGHRLRSDGRRHRVERWWRPAYGRSADPADTAEILAEAVRRQLVSDVPVGTFLSGGIDSALVTAAAAEQLPTLDTFTVGFDEPGWDETKRARKVSDSLQVKAHELRIDPDRYVAGLGEALWHLDAPLNHAHSVHLLELARFARRHVAVALTGEGSDEIFLGYPRYRLFLMGRMLRFVPDRLARWMGRPLRAHGPRWARLLDAATSDEINAVSVNAAFVPIRDAAALVGLDDPEAALGPRRGVLAETSGLAPIEQLAELERRTYLVSLLQRMDRMTMAAGLEARVPVLDEAMVGLATALAPAAKLDLFHSKKPMRQAAERRFGRAFAHARKFGFGVPLDAWLAGEGALARLLARLLADGRTRSRGWIDVDLSRRFLEEHRSGKHDRTEALWGVLNLELWARVAVDRDGPEGTSA